MTEAEWLASTDPNRMLWFIGGSPDVQGLWPGTGRPGHRKWRLLGAACCRRIWPLITEDECRRVVEAVEAVADGAASEADLRAVADAAVDCGYRVHHDRHRHRAYAATDALGRGVGLDATLEHSCSCAVGHAAYAVGKRREDESRAQVCLIRCVFGNPFRPTAGDPPWLASTAVALARGIYEERAFDRLPILADALQDSGCEDADILAHCRGPGPHVRGCWVVDLILGKE
ncbi:MAG: hypothetical protein JWO38_5713 [Gemmataceae bacterium]|nr:hypothetical protein [Gemmataceae bacterium]